MSLFIFVCWQIKIQMQISWVGWSTSIYLASGVFVNSFMISRFGTYGPLLSFLPTRYKSDDLMFFHEINKNAIFFQSISERLKNHKKCSPKMKYCLKQQECGGLQRNITYRQRCWWEKLPGTRKLLKDSPWIDCQSSVNVGSVCTSSLFQRDTWSWNDWNTAVWSLWSF